MPGVTCGRAWSTAPLSTAAAASDGAPWWVIGGQDVYEEFVEHVDEIGGAKRRENLVAHADDARVSKQLATMVRDGAWGWLKASFALHAAHLAVTEKFTDEISAVIEIDWPTPIMAALSNMASPKWARAGAIGRGPLKVGGSYALRPCFAMEPARGYGSR